jgi:hypothetical protein
MNQTTKRLFAIVLGAFVCIHFVLIFVYCSPTKFKIQKLDNISRLYIYPIFHQNWGLFVPAPNAQHKLFVRYKTINGYSNWQDILDEEIMNHKKNRILGNETKVLLLSNSLIYELNYLYEKPSCIFLKKPVNKEFEVLQFEINQYLKFNMKVENLTSYELLLVSSGSKNAVAYYMK